MTPDTLPSNLGSRLADDIVRLPEVVGVRLVIWATVVFAVAVLTRAALAAGVRFVWRLGLDRERLLGRFTAMLRVLIWVVALLLALRPLFLEVPVLTVTSVALLSAIVALAVPGQLQNLAAGIGLALRPRYREGDQIELHGFRGSIRTLGLARTQLRVDDGSVVWLPNAIHDREPVRVDRSTGAAPVRVRISIPTRGRDTTLNALTVAMGASPFRRADSPPRIAPSAEDEREWTIELQTWATRDLDLVRRSVRRTADRVLLEMSNQGDTP